MNGTNVINEIPDCYLAPSSMWGHSKKVSPVRNESTPDTKYAGALILGNPASRTLKNIFVVYKPPSLWPLVTASQMD
jgi:hypothetical protein